MRTKLTRVQTCDEWESTIRPFLPLPLTPAQASIDLQWLARAEELARPKQVRIRGRTVWVWEGLGYRELAARWGWLGKAGDERARRLLTSFTWVDAGLPELHVYQGWCERRAAHQTRRRSKWEREALAEQAGQEAAVAAK